VGALGANPVYAARFRYLTGRAHNPLTRGQAHAAVAAALLRHLQVIVTRRCHWDPVLAGGAADQPSAAYAARILVTADGRASPPAA